MENQVISILQKMDEKLEYIGKKLDSVEEIVHEQGETLKEHSTILKEHSTILEEHSTILKEHSTILKEHSTILENHSMMLGALKTGQEVVSAEISELRLQNAIDFGEIKATLKSHEDSIELLKEDNWNNKKATLRIQKTMGLS